MNDLATATLAPDREGALTSNSKLKAWLRLLTCTTLIEREVRQKLCERLDTTIARLDLLSQLDRAPTGLAMRELSSHLMMTNGNVTGLNDAFLMTRLTRADMAQLLELLGKLEHSLAAAGAHGRDIKTAHVRWSVDCPVGTITLDLR